MLRLTAAIHVSAVLAFGQGTEGVVRLTYQTLFVEAGKKLAQNAVACKKSDNSIAENLVQSQGHINRCGPITELQNRSG
jgi:hypothetical protein